MIIHILLGLLILLLVGVVIGGAAYIFTKIINLPIWLYMPLGFFMAIGTVIIILAGFAAAAGEFAIAVFPHGVG